MPRRSKRTRNVDGDGANDEDADAAEDGSEPSPPADDDGGAEEEGGMAEVVAMTEADEVEAKPLPRRSSPRTKAPPPPPPLEPPAEPPAEPEPSEEAPADEAAAEDPADPANDDAPALPEPAGEPAGEPIGEPAAAAAEQPAKKRRGRPPGSKNGSGKRPRGRPRKHPPPSSSPDSYAHPPSAAAAKNESEDDEDEGSVEVAAAYDPTEFPELALDDFDVLDRSEYAGSFVRPLFDEPTPALEIAYSHRRAAASERAKAQRKKNRILNECNKLRARYQEKRLELSLAHDAVREKSRECGAWTRKVFDLELEEECPWNDHYKKLIRYKEETGRLPPHAKKCETEEEKMLSQWLDRIRGQKNSEDKGDDDDDDDDPAGDAGDGGIEDEEAVTPPPDEGPPKKKRRGLNKNKRHLRDYPHRVEVLTSLGVAFEPHREARWENMFQRLLEYKEEMGTLRFPTDEQCAAAGDEDLIALQKWVKAQVLNARYGKQRNPELVRRLEGIGFDFEKWYARPGKQKRGGRKAGTSKAKKEGGEATTKAKAEEGAVKTEEGADEEEKGPVKTEEGSGEAADDEAAEDEEGAAYDAATEADEGKIMPAEEEEEGGNDDVRAGEDAGVKDEMIEAI
ncbi:hypothetical protein ACHAWF_010306 [Thalassiosira exigua]